MKSLSKLEFVGVTFTIVGSFLPWERTGDIISYVTPGIQVDIANFKYWSRGILRFPVDDNGGVLVILLTSVIVLLALRPPRFIKNPILWNLIISLLLMASSLFFVARWLAHRFEELSVVGAATIEIGLISVVVGSAILLWSAISKHRQANK